MCLVCNPYCGRCRPPARKAIRCPQCKKDNTLSRDECIVYLGYIKADKKKDLLRHGDTAQCEHCGADISDELREKIVPQTCLFMGLVCGYPCGRHQFPKRVGDLDCAKPIPLRKLTDEEWEALKARQDVVGRRGAM